MPTPVKAKVAKSKKDKFIVRPGFHVLIQNGRDRNTYGEGDIPELTASQAKKVAHQTEPYSEEAHKRILDYIEARDKTVEE